MNDDAPPLLPPLPPSYSTRVDSASRADARATANLVRVTPHPEGLHAHPERRGVSRLPQQGPTYHVRGSWSSSIRKSARPPMHTGRSLGERGRKHRYARPRSRGSTKRSKMMAGGGAAMTAKRHSA